MILFFFFNDTATTEIYTLSLHDALPISLANRDDLAFGAHRTRRRGERAVVGDLELQGRVGLLTVQAGVNRTAARSEEHTSELQSPCNLVCRLLLEKKKQHQLQDLRRIHT